MEWPDSRYTVSFQSRFGPEKWLEPSTADILKGLHARGIRKPLVVAPGFTTDCLETLDELGNEGRARICQRRRRSRGLRPVSLPERRRPMDSDPGWSLRRQARAATKP